MISAAGVNAVHDSGRNQLLENDISSQPICHEVIAFTITEACAYAETTVTIAAHFRLTRPWLRDRCHAA
jgi:hypothetical protein